MASAPTVTSDQRRILKAIKNYLSENGYPPSLREIALQADLSLMVVYRQLIQIELKGYLVRTPGISRGLALTEAGRTV